MSTVKSANLLLLMLTENLTGLAANCEGCKKRLASAELFFAFVWSCLFASTRRVRRQSLGKSKHCPELRFPFEYNSGCLSSERIMWANEPIADGETSFLWMQDVRVERIWEQDYFHVFSQSPERWFNVYLTSVGCFLWFLDRNTNKKKFKPRKKMRRRRSEVGEWNFMPNRRQVKRKMLHLLKTVFGFVRLLSDEKKPAKRVLIMMANSFLEGISIYSLVFSLVDREACKFSNNWGNNEFFRLHRASSETNTNTCSRSTSEFSDTNEFSWENVFRETVLLPTTNFLCLWSSLSVALFNLLNRM